jgi:hypothetical protein
MAKSYLGYVERDQAAFVNWASIGSQIAKDLETIRVKRQEQRDELDRVTNEAVTTINELTANQPKLVSEFYMDGANDMRQYLLMMYKEMKAGRLQPSEYMKKKQVLMDGVTQLGDAAKAFATDYEESMKLMQEGKSAGQKIFQDEQYDAFKSTEGKGIYVNPADGRVYIAKRNPDGTINDNPEDLLSVNKLYARRKDIVYKYDVVGEANKNVKVLGDITKAKRSGGVLTLKDVMQNPEYLKAENDIIKSMMSSPRNVGSILSDYVGGYSFTLKPEEAKGDPNKILLVEDGMGLYQPQLTDAQRKKAEEAIRAQLRVQLDRVETPMPVYAPQQPSEAVIGRGQARKQNADHLELIRKIYAGTPQEAIAAGDAIRATLNPNIRSIDKSGGNIVINFKDGSRETLPIPKTGTGSSSAFEQFVTRAGGFLIPELPIEQAFLDWQNSAYRGRSEAYSPAAFVSRGVQVAPALNSINVDAIGEKGVKSMPFPSVLNDEYLKRDDTSRERVDVIKASGVISQMLSQAIPGASVNITQNNDAITVTVDGKSYVIGGEGNEISDRNSRGVYAEILKKTNKIVSDYFGAGQSGGAQRGELD